MVNFFYVAITLFACTTIIPGGLDVPKNLAPLENKAPFGVRWRMSNGNVDKVCKIQLNESQYIRYDSTEMLPAKDEDAFVEKIKKNPQFLRYPSVIFYCRGYKAFYPIECLIRSSLNSKKKLIESMLKTDSDLVNGFKDYHPLKAIFWQMRENEGFNTNSLELIDVFLRYNNIDLESPFPAHIGHGDDPDEALGECTPLSYFENARQAVEKQKIKTCKLSPAQCQMIKSKLLAKKAEQDTQKKVELLAQKPAPNITSYNGWFSTKTLLWGSVGMGIGLGLYWLKNNYMLLTTAFTHLSSNTKNMPIKG